MAGLATDSVCTLPLLMPEPAVCCTIVALHFGKDLHLIFMEFVTQKKKLSFSNMHNGLLERRDAVFHNIRSFVSFDPKMIFGLFL